MHFNAEGLAFIQRQSTTTRERSCTGAARILGGSVYDQRLTTNADIALRVALGTRRHFGESIRDPGFEGARVAMVDVAYSARRTVVVGSR